MVREYSAAYKSTLSQVSSPESPLILLEISHPDLTQPVRVVNDTVDINSNGNLFIGCPFRVTLPDDIEQSLPKAKLAIDNVGRDLMYWIEKSCGGVGSKVRFIQIMRSRPNLIEWEITMALTNVQATMQEISAELGFTNLFSRPAVRFQYRPELAPGIF